MPHRRIDVQGQFPLGEPLAKPSGDLFERAVGDRLRISQQGAFGVLLHPAESLHDLPGGYEVDARLAHSLVAAHRDVLRLERHTRQSKLPADLGESHGELGRVDEPFKVGHLVRCLALVPPVREEGAPLRREEDLAVGAGESRQVAHVRRGR